MESLSQDLRYAVRTCRRSPYYTLAALLTIAFGVGANTAVFTVVDHVILRPLPYRAADRLVMFWHADPRKGSDREALSYPALVDLQSQSRTVELAGVSPVWNLLLATRSGPERTPGHFVSANLFTLLGVSPVMGRGFLPADGEPGAEPVALLSYSLWQRYFGGDPEALGKMVDVGMPYRVVGVLPARFRLLEEVDVWIPLETSPAASPDRARRTLRVVGRLTPDAKMEDARAEFRTMARQWELEYPDTHGGLGAELVPLHDVVVGPVRPALLLLLAVVGFVLLVACANLGTLLLGRAVSRRKEIAIRAALGAGKSRIASLLLTESVVLSLAGGVCGLALGYWAVTLLPAILPSRIPRQEEIGIDARVMGFTFAAALLTGLLAALLPVLQASRADLRSSLAQVGGGEAPAGRRLRSLLAVSEIGVTFALVVGAGLLLRSFILLMSVDPGFDRRHVLSLQVSSDLGETSRRVAFYHELFDRLRALPGVLSVGASTRLPFREGGSAPIEVYGRAETAGERQEVEIRRASIDYFRTMGIRLVSGRSFTREDDLDAPPVAVINETAARRLWPGEDPLGGRLRAWRGDSPGPWFTVIGVVGDVKHFGLDAAARPEVYLSFDQGPPFGPLLVIRASRDPTPLIAAVRENIRALDPEMGVFHFATLDQLVAESVAQRRFTTLLASVFGALALVLAVTGIYGVVSHLVAERTREMGIRMALGAGRGNIFRLVVGHGLKLAAAGLTLGLAGSLVIQRYVASQLYQVSSSDPLTWLGTSSLMALAVFLACYVPARRATRVDPLIALRAE